MKDSAREGPGADSSEAALAVLVVDDERRCIDANPDACLLLDVSREQAVGVTLDDLFAEDARERFDHVWRAFRAGGGHAGPFRVDAATPVDVDLRVTTDVGPARHLVVLSPVKLHRRALTAGSNGAAPRRRGGRRASLPALSARERQIVGMLAAGDTDGRIASRLGLSPATVRTHVRNAKAKLGAHTRAQAVAISLEHQIIE